MKKILFLFGTRPEAIKMAPLIKEFQKNSNTFTSKVCVTAQHREMLDQVLGFFKIIPDYDLNIMKQGQSLFDITSIILNKLEPVLEDYKPDLVLVQGDTTTAFAGALAAFYKKIKVVHVEAGLRSSNKYSPFPEEMNRIMAGHLSSYHFAPTSKAKENLSAEGIKDNVWVVGNSVIDALFLGLSMIKEQDENKYFDYFKDIDFSKKIILVTGHRRESFGEPFKDICYALKEIASKYNNVEIVYPVHLNPNVREPVTSILQNIQNVRLIEPLDYPYLLWLMNKSFFVVTDSGGIQEEAPSLGKPVLVMRDVTERVEGIEAGTAKLVGTNIDSIVSSANLLLESESEYNKMSNAVNPYGDGRTSERVLEILKKEQHLL